MRKTTTAHRAGGTERANLPLAQRYQPSKIQSLLLDPARVKILSRWAKRRATGYEGVERAAILMGPPGSGKTSAARVLLRDAGFQVVEFGPGSLTTEASLAKQVRRVVKRRPLPGTRPAAVLIDDFDGLCALERDAEPGRRGARASGTENATDNKGDEDEDDGDRSDRGGRARIGNLVGLLAEAKATWGPVVLCSNDTGSAEVRMVRDVCLQVWVDAVPRARLLYLAKIVARAEAHDIDDADAGRLADAACGDIRRLLNGLDVRLRVGPVDLDDSRPVCSGASDVFFNNFDAVEALLAGSVGGRPIDCVEAAAIYRGDPLLRRAMVHHNYPGVVVENMVAGGEVDAVDRLAALADNFSAADGMDFGRGATGSAGLGHDGDGAASWRAGSAGSGGWAYGANPATAVLWACSARVLAAPARAARTTVVPRVKFCSPSSSDWTAYAEGRLRRRAAIAIALPVPGIVGAREPLLAEFDLVRAAFVGMAKNAYAAMDGAQRRATVDRMLWAGATRDAVAALLNWQRIRGLGDEKRSLMPPPPPLSRHSVALVADMAARAQVCTVARRGINASTAAPVWSSPAAVATVASSSQRDPICDVQTGTAPTRKRKGSPTTAVTREVKRRAPSGQPLAQLPPARAMPLQSSGATSWSGRARGSGRGRGRDAGSVGYRALSRGRGRGGTANRGRW